MIGESTHFPSHWNKKSTKMFYLSNPAATNQRILKALIEIGDKKELMVALKHIPRSQIPKKLIQKACHLKSYQCLNGLLENGIYPSKSQLKRFAADPKLKSKPFKIFDKADVELDWLSLAYSTLGNSSSNQLKKLKYFIEKGKLKVKRTDLVYRAAAQSNISALNILIEAGGNVNRKCKNKTHFGTISETPLHYAAVEADREIAKVLLDADADPNISDSKGRTPLHISTAWTIKKMDKHHRFIQLLLNNGADVNQKSDGIESPMERALLHERHLIRSLHKYNGNPEAKFLCKVWCKSIFWTWGSTSEFKDLGYVTYKKLSKRN